MGAFIVTLLVIPTFSFGWLTSVKKKLSVTAKKKKPVVRKRPDRKVSLAGEHIVPDLTIPADKRPKPFPIVGFGASAGGLEAFMTLLSNLDSNLGMAYVLIMHLSRKQKSALAQILQAKTQMPVQTVTDGMEVMADNVYVIPPNTFMSLVDGHLTLAPRTFTSVGNFSIDYFLTALASVYKNNAIGVILSGTASDGTLGLKAVKAEGGITFSQDESAEFFGMPGHAFDSGYVDFKLPPKRIAEELARLVKSPYTVLPSDKIEAVHVAELNGHRDDLRNILSVVKNKLGIDFFNQYKHASIYRRIIRRMVLNKFENLAEYYSFIKTNAREVDLLYDDFLINVTHFFRDPEFYEILINKVFPEFLKRGQPIRIWVAGCSTGEEAYSIAISLIEFLEKKGQNLLIQIFASDLDGAAIEKARAGVYPVSALQRVSSEHLKRFFRKLDGHYQIVKSVREICIFSQHNLLSDPPFSRMDLISCQNVLIYLEAQPQKRILQSFHYALNASGFLFLGKSETTGAASDLFELNDKKTKLYSAKPTTSPRPKFNPSVSAFVLPHIVNSSPGQQPEVTIEKVMSQLMLSRFVHPSVVVNKNMVIIQFFGITSRYLAPVTGKASFNVLKMIREDLVVDLRSLVQQARKTGNVAVKEGILVYNDKIPQKINIEVVPRITNGDIYFLVVFKERAVVQIQGTLDGKLLQTGIGHERATISKLKAELVQSKEVIRTTSEEYETTYEELQANNEEILSSNEELQSVNEELEASKEELQSANEELTTIVEELSQRNIQLKQSQTYAEAIVETMHNPLLVLTSDFNVRMANKAFYDAFGLTPENTEGHYVFSLSEGNWDIPQLREHLKDVLPKKTNFKEFEIKHTFSEIGERELIVNAYRLKQGDNPKESLILLAFDDITRRTLAEASLQKSQEQLKLSLIGDSIGTWWWSLQTGEMKWSRENELLNGMKAGTFQGLYRDWENLVHPDDISNLKEAIKNSFYERVPIEVEYRIVWPDNSVHWMLSKGHPYFDPYGQPERMIGVSMDTTERKMQSENLENQVDLRTAELQKAMEEQRTVNDQLKQFAFITSHDLQEPLRKIQIFSNRMSNPEANLSSYAKKYVDKINASALRMSTLLKDLLSFSVLVNTDVTTANRVDLNFLLKEVINDFELVIEEAGAVVNLGPLPVITAEPAKMNQLFHNLLSNALKFCTDKPIINITSADVTEDDFLEYPELKKETHYIAIRVEDNGIGFDQKYARQIFTLFQRLRDKVGVEGTGMGLAICKKIVEDHGGLIFVKSVANEGATFTVYLPAEIIDEPKMELIAS